VYEKIEKPLDLYENERRPKRRSRIELLTNMSPRCTSMMSIALCMRNSRNHEAKPEQSISKHRKKLKSSNRQGRPMTGYETKDSTSSSLLISQTCPSKKPYSRYKYYSNSASIVETFKP